MRNPRNGSPLPCNAGNPWTHTSRKKCFMGAYRRLNAVGLLCCAVATGAGFAQAAEPAAATTLAPAPAPASDYTLTTNVGLFSQYVFRGVAYTQERPAIQGGVDFAHSSGLYAGIWGSQLSGKAIQNATGEIDLYAGYAFSYGDFSYDAGMLQFLYPDGKYSGTSQGYNTLEAYASVGWKWVKLKYSHELTDYFGYNNTSFGSAGNGRSRGSHYLEANAVVDLGSGWTVEAHVGRQVVKNYEQYSFTDYKLGVGKDLGSGWQAKVGYSTTNADSTLYTIDGIDTGRSKLVASIVRFF